VGEKAFLLGFLMVLSALLSLVLLSYSYIQAFERGSRVTPGGCKARRKEVCRVFLGIIANGNSYYQCSLFQM
jgi:hypothetical protein